MKKTRVRLICLARQTRNCELKLIADTFKSYRYRPNVEFGSILWEFNPYDDDPFPSVPHGDSYNHHLQLCLQDGAIYKNRKFVKRINKKDFNRLKKDKQLCVVIEKAYQYYSEHHPYETYIPIIWHMNTWMTKINLLNKKAKKVGPIFRIIKC